MCLKDKEYSFRVWILDYSTGDSLNLVPIGGDTVHLAASTDWGAVGIAPG
jgi:hypothetical protein